MAGWKFLTCCNRLHTYFGPPAPLISTHPIHRIACILWVRQYFTLWPSMLFGKAVDTCQKIHRFFAVGVCRDCFLLGERKSRKSVQVFFSNKNGPWKNEDFFKEAMKRWMVKRWFSLIFLFEFGRIFEVMFSCLWILWNILSFQDLASLCLSEEKSNRSFPPKKKKRPMLELPPYPLRVTTRKNSILIGSGIILTKPGTCDLGSWVGGGWG